MQEGLKEKFLVFKADSGERVENCFVLRPDKDPVAVRALRAYAGITPNRELAKDIYKWVGVDNEPDRWITLDELLPGNGLVIWLTDGIRCDTGIYDGDHDEFTVDHGFIDPWDVVAWKPFPDEP